MKKLLWSLGTLAVGTAPVLFTTACAKEEVPVDEPGTENPGDDNPGDEDTTPENPGGDSGGNNPTPEAPDESDPSVESYDFDFTDSQSLNEYKRLFVEKEIETELLEKEKTNRAIITTIVIKIAISVGKRYVFNIAKEQLANILSQRYNDNMFSINMTLDEFAEMQDSVTGNFNQYFFAKADAEKLGTTFGNSGDFEFQKQWFLDNLIEELPVDIEFKSFQPGWIDNNIEVTYTDGMNDVDVMYKLGEKNTQAEADEENADRGTNFTRAVSESKDILSTSVAQLVEMSKYIDTSEQADVQDEWLEHFTEQQSRTGFDMYSALLGMGVFFVIFVVIPVLFSLLMTFITAAVIVLIIGAIISSNALPTNPSK